MEKMPDEWVEEFRHSVLQAVNTLLNRAVSVVTPKEMREVCQALNRVLDIFDARTKKRYGFSTRDE